MQQNRKRVPSSPKQQYRKRVPSSPKLLSKSVSRFAYPLFLVFSSWTVLFFLWIYLGIYVTCASTRDMWRLKRHKVPNNMLECLGPTLVKKLPILIASIKLSTKLEVWQFRNQNFSGTSSSFHYCNI